MSEISGAGATTQAQSLDTGAAVQIKIKLRGVSKPPVWRRLQVRADTSVFPFQEDLRSGLRPEDHFDTEVAPAMAEHAAPVFEEICRAWVRRNLGESATRVTPWWGRSLDSLRRSGERSSEEIDIVGVARSRVRIVGECKWTGGRMSPKVLHDLERYKVPALR